MIAPVNLSRHSNVCPSADGVQTRSWPGSNACASVNMPARAKLMGSLMRMMRMAVVHALAEDDAKTTLDLQVAGFLECADGAVMIKVKFAL